MLNQPSKELLSHKQIPPNKFPQRETCASSIGVLISKLFIPILLLQIFLLSQHYSLSSTPSTSLENVPPSEKQTLPSTTCQHGTVYVYDLPPMFNKDVLANCHNLNPWNISYCDGVSNNGLGPKAMGPSSVPQGLSDAWYWTHMLTSEVLFHNKMLRHKCRTLEPELATVFYIPFYAGLGVEKYLFGGYSAEERDRPFNKLVEWVVDQPQWNRFNGSDHFIMLGRVTWDFRRVEDHQWGAKFINNPSMSRVFKLGIESNPSDQLEMSVPYLTGFHPKSKSELTQWMNFVHSTNRTSLFTFVGAKRNLEGDFRTILYDQCYNEPGSCQLVDCSGKQCTEGTWRITESFLHSDFCLQPRGDTYTRKSTFDCMLAGSIPVFLWKQSTLGQFEWFLGNKPEEYSVFIDRRDVRNGTRIREVLEGYSKEEVSRMREKVISLIPNFVYGDLVHDSADEFEDAFDLAVDGVLSRFNKQRNNTIGE